MTLFEFGCFVSAAAQALHCIALQISATFELLLFHLFFFCAWQRQKLCHIRAWHALLFAIHNSMRVLRSFPTIVRVGTLY